MSQPEQPNLEATQPITPQETIARSVTPTESVEIPRNDELPNPALKTKNIWKMLLIIASFIIVVLGLVFGAIRAKDFLQSQNQTTSLPPDEINQPLFLNQNFDSSPIIPSVEESKTHITNNFQEILKQNCVSREIEENDYSYTVLEIEDNKLPISLTDDFPPHTTRCIYTYNEFDPNGFVEISPTIQDSPIQKILIGDEQSINVGYHNWPLKMDELTLSEWNVQSIKLSEETTLVIEVDTSGGPYLPNDITLREVGLTAYRKLGNYYLVSISSIPATFPDTLWKKYGQTCEPESFCEESEGKYELTEIEGFKNEYYETYWSDYDSISTESKYVAAEILRVIMSLEIKYK